MMRNIRTLMIALALFLGATTMLTAQVKIAHIDVQKLLEEMPERKSIESQLKKMEQGYMNDIQAAIKELQAKAQKYQNEAAALTEAQLKAREAELLKKVKSSIEKIAKQKGLQYVLDSSAGSSVIVATGDDLYSTVKKDLGF